MKAKFIYEALDFERGMDPKESLSIGIEGKLRNAFKKSSGLSYDEASISTVLHYIVMTSDLSEEEKLQFAKFLILVKKAEVTDAIIDVAIRNEVGEDLILYLISKGDEKIMDYIKSKASKTKNRASGWVH
jgi:hypothetical protein